MLTDAINGIRGLAEIVQKGYQGNGNAETYHRTENALMDPMGGIVILGGVAGGLYAMHEIYHRYTTVAPLTGQLLLYGGGALVGLLAAGLVAPAIERYGPAIATGLAGMLGNAARTIMPPKEQEGN